MQQPSSDRVRSWPFVSLSIRPEHLAEWTALARATGRSRADLLREALSAVGLPYARAIVRSQAAAPAAPPNGAKFRAGTAGSGLYTTRRMPSSDDPASAAG